MFTYIQIAGDQAKNFKGYVDYEFKNNQLSLTLVRGMKALHHLIIDLNKVTDLTIDKFYGNHRIKFVYDGLMYSIINTGYGESKYIENHLVNAINA